MTISVYAPGEPSKTVMGPADVARHVKRGAVFVVSGAPAENDFGRWASALGAAAMRGATVRGLS